MNASDSFFDSGRRPPSSEASRPRAVNPVTGREQSWQSASNYASPLDNPHGLITWKLRELVKGLSMRPDLARMILTGAVLDGDDHGKIDEIIKSAHATAEIDAKANEGTAVHAALSRAFLGHEVPSEYAQHVASFFAELTRNGLTPVATEVKTLCVALGVIGHTDLIVRTADGRHLILDVKTGKLGDAKRKFAVQCKAYAGSEYIDDGANGWTPTPFPLDQTEAILAHVDPITGATALYRVDLVLGFYGATLAEKVRNWGKIEVLSPYTPVHPSIPQASPHVAIGVDPQGGAIVAAELQSDGTTHLSMVAVARDDHPGVTVNEHGSGGVTVNEHPEPERRALTPMEMIQGATSQQTLDMAYRRVTQNGEHPSQWSPDFKAAYDAKAAELTQPVAEHVTPAGEHTLDELMATKNTKPILQKMAKDLGCHDLAHDRKWLALWILAAQQGADPSQAAAYAKSKGVAPIGGTLPVRPGNASAAVLAPTPAESTPFALKHIREAATAEDIERFRSNIVERSGDMAWTDEMAAAAAARVAELAPAVSTPSVLDHVRACGLPQDIAELWTRTTLGGSAPELWTPEIKAAADARLGEIQAAQPPPPANPYGPQQ